MENFKNVKESLNVFYSNDVQKAKYEYSFVIIKILINCYFFVVVSANISEIENTKQEIINDQFLLKQIESVIAAKKGENDKLNARFNKTKKSFETETIELRGKTEKCNK